LARAALLDAAGHPTLRFAGDTVDFDRRLGAVDGLLTLRGRSAPLTLRAERFGCYTHPLLQREVCGGDFDATVELGRWGLAGAAAEQALADRVRLRIQVEALQP